MDSKAYKESAAAFVGQLSDKLKPEFDKLQAYVTALEAASAEKDTMITELNDSLKEAEGRKTAGPDEVFTKGKEKVTVLIPRVNVPGVGVVTAQDLKDNKLKVGDQKIFDYLKSKKSGMFTVTPQ